MATTTTTASTASIATMATTEATTSATATSPSPLSMSTSPSPETDSTPTALLESIEPPDSAMPPFTPGQCLFCPHPSPNFSESVMHMQKSHGLFVPHQQHLAVDLETLFGYLHLVIFGYRECIQCGTARSTVQAVQQHMAAKGHCTFDISEEDSEFAEFYDFSEPEDETETDLEGEDEEKGQEETATTSSRKPQLAGEDSVRLPSGRIISRRSATPAGPSFNELRRRTRTSLPPSQPAPQLEHAAAEPNEEEAPSNEGDLNPDKREARQLSKREKREWATVAYQLANLSANDRNSLMHLPLSQQRAVLATQFQHAERVQKQERRRQGKIDRKGNKNLYAYWHTETPVYQCG